MTELPCSHPDAAFRAEWVATLYRAQAEICAALEELEREFASPERPPKQFVEGPWERPSGGGGKSKTLEDGAVFEKAGVNVSAVFGSLPSSAARVMCSKWRPELLQLLKEKEQAEGASLGFFAAGLSTVLHPHNPMAPTLHANYRLFQLFERSSGDGSSGKSLCWWFGGGTDLTPSFVFAEDCRFFHEALKAVCDKHDPLYYPRFKRWCDVYFRIHHRGESRGIGGIFFDGLSPEKAASHFSTRDFAADALGAIAPVYVQLLRRRVNSPFTARQKRWQQIRRGRYVEFNLVYDRGTKFGLAMPGTKARNVLMSLPLTARWEVDEPSDDGTLTEEESEALSVFRLPRDWIDFDQGALKGFVIPHEDVFEQP